jgi:hypothetical protein
VQQHLEAARQTIRAPAPCAVQAARSRQGKVEKSLLSFATTYPGWQPGAAAKQMLSGLRAATPQLGTSAYFGNPVLTADLPAWEYDTDVSMVGTAPARHPCCAHTHMCRPSTQARRAWAARPGQAASHQGLTIPTQRTSALQTARQWVRLPFSVRLHTETSHTTSQRPAKHCHGRSTGYPMHACISRCR